MIPKLIYIASVIYLVAAERYSLTRALEKNIKRDYNTERLEAPPEGPKESESESEFRNRICKGLKCPEFSQEGNTVIDFAIQKRFYNKAKFITAISNNPKCDYNSALMDAYMELYAYRNGSNDRGEMFKMTVPVLTLVYINHTALNCQEKYKIMFYLPPEMQKDPPKPTSNTVQIEEVMGYSVYIHTFSGHIEERLVKELALFRALAKYLDLCYDHSDYFTAVYDSPWRQENRRNEIWFATKESC